MKKIVLRAMFKHLLHSRLFLLTLTVVGVTAFILFSPSSRFLKGSLTDDRVLALCDTSHDGTLTIPEMRQCLGAMISAIVHNTPAYDLDSNGKTEKADMRILIQSIRAFLVAECGNGIIEAAEKCDDGNTATGDGCSDVCAVEPAFTCASGNPSVCTRIPVCRNGIVEGAEQCDDNNAINDDFCTNDCKLARCGDGILQGAEQCDDGNQVNNDACSNVCRRPACGDNIVQAPEQCDDGNQSNADACTTACTFPVCGNGILEGNEQCDDHNQINEDTCTGLCKLASCGDGFKQGAEECDDGNQNNLDACTTSCKFPVCNNGILEGTEQCDDGNQNNNDSCTMTCRNATCGDGFKQGTEECDDGNHVNNDTCTGLCKLATCGDGFVQGAEQCDDGNRMDTDRCSNACVTAVCGAITEYDISTPNSGPYGITKGPDNTIWFTEKNTNKVAKRTQDGTVTEYTVPSTNSIPMGITAGLYGTMYFIEYSSVNGNKIGKVSQNGAFEEVLVPTASSLPMDITTGLDGSIWFVEYSGNKIGKIPFNGGVPIEFTIPTAGSNPTGIATAPNGDIWFTEHTGNRIGKITPSGTFSEFTPLPTGSVPQHIAAGSDGNMWFTEANNKIGRITPDGLVDHFTIPTPSSSPNMITQGPDGNAWFTEAAANKIGKITPQGAITEYQVSSPNTQLNGITTGPDGNIWFTEFNANKLGKIQVCPAGICGNGIREGTEQCEDHNTVSGDGCSATCAIETGFTCTGVPVSTCLPTVPVCGDGYKQGTEECDDHNQINNDACSNSCKLAFCGDGIVQGAEQCDDGNTANGDDCSSLCQSTFSIARSCTDTANFKSVGTIPSVSVSSILSFNDDAFALGFVLQPDGKSVLGSYRHSVSGTGAVWLREAQLGVPGLGSVAKLINAGGTLYAIRQKDPGQWTEATREDLVFRRIGNGQWESLGAPWKSPDIPQISSLAVLSGVPYVSVSNYGFVYRYDGNKSWSQLGTTAVPQIGTLTSAYGKLFVLGRFLDALTNIYVGRVASWNGTSWAGATDLWNVADMKASDSTLLVVGQNSSTGQNHVYRVPADSTTTVDTHINDALQSSTVPQLGVVDGLLYGLAGHLFVYPSVGQGWRDIGLVNDIVTSPTGVPLFQLQDGLVILKTNFTCKKVNVPPLLISCGNGLVQIGEQCDDGNQIDNDACRNSCVLPRCGDSVLELGEQCDEGGNTANCTSACLNRSPVCGDGYQQGAEQCDDGNLVNGDGCTSSCTTICGDGIKRGAEQCDDGDGIDTNACKNNCQLPPPPPLLCRRIACNQFATHYGVQYHQLSYMGLSNGTPYYSGCELYGTKYLINGQSGQITSNGTCTQSNAPSGTPVGGALASQIAGMLGVNLSQPAEMTTSPSVSSVFAVMNGHNSKVTIGATGFIFSAQSCGIQEYSCNCAIPDVTDPRYCYQKGTASAHTIVCGDGLVEGTEQCDDSNNVSGDGCSATCSAEAPAKSCTAAGNAVCSNGVNPCRLSGFSVPMCKSFGSTNPVTLPICCGTSTYSATGCIPADCS